ncbi:MAG: hypothetical protein PHC60_04820 [Heliobacteriaceae bacterium]|nr:hypothetical protein [Heliobacteriaceae bacterium]MDD4587699.1 hypothetical protein [Heliobacteriaceae bacterium]
MNGLRYREHKMCHRLSAMIGEDIAAEMRLPDGGTRTYTGKLVAVGDDYLEMEVEAPGMEPAVEGQVVIEQFGFGRRFFRVLIPLLLLTTIFPFRRGFY